MIFVCEGKCFASDGFLWIRESSYCTTLTNVNGQSASRYPGPTTPDSISPGPMKSFLGESVVTT